MLEYPEFLRKNYSNLYNRTNVRPVKGKVYELVKILPAGDGEHNGYIEDIRYLQYSGPQYSEDELLKMNGLTKTNGYYPGHDFEGPDEAEMSLGLEDNRNTLLWLPQVTADGNTEMEIEFYTSDISSLFSIVCLVYELNGDGIGEANKSFKVIRTKIVSDKDNVISE